MKIHLPAMALLCAALLVPASAAFAENEDMPLPGDVQTAPAVQHHLNTHGKKLAAPKAASVSAPQKHTGKRKLSRAKTHRKAVAAKSHRNTVATKGHKSRPAKHAAPSTKGKKHHSAGKARKHAKKH